MPPLDPSALDRRIIACTRCPRLRAYCHKVALAKKAAFREQDYWGQPVPNFWPPPPKPDLSGPPRRSGSPDDISSGRVAGAKALRAPAPHFEPDLPFLAPILIVGLAPAAHGGNRTGRMFTGDRSGDFLYGAMHEVGLASQPTSQHRGDGLALRHCVVTAAAHCAPPANKLTPQELENCLPWLDETFDALPALRAVVCLGRVAFDQVIKLHRRRGWITGHKAHKFAHAAEFEFVTHNSEFIISPTLLCSYHPSQQNTFTGKLTRPMLVAVLARAVEIAHREPLRSAAEKNP